MRSIAIAADQRSTVFPDVATFRGQGYPDIVMTAWSGVFAPRATPPAVMEKLSAALRQANASAAAIESRRRSGGADLWRTPPESHALLASEIARWERCARESGVEPERADPRLRPRRA